jgi:hypothetical protein
MQCQHINISQASAETHNTFSIHHSAVMGNGERDLDERSFPGSPHVQQDAEMIGDRNRGHPSDLWAIWRNGASRLAAASQVSQPAIAFDWQNGKGSGSRRNLGMATGLRRLDGFIWQ